MIAVFLFSQQTITSFPRLTKMYEVKELGVNETCDDSWSLIFGLIVFNSHRFKVNEDLFLNVVGLSNVQVIFISSPCAVGVPKEKDDDVDDG